MVNKQKPKSGRINLTLPPKLNRRFDEYCIAIATRNGHITHGIKTIIARIAIYEFLNKHEKDMTINLAEEKKKCED